MIEKLLGMADGQWFVALLIVGALTASAKAMFGLFRSTSQDRKDFLDLWSRRSSDDLWLEVAVRHQFGSYLPASLIRQVLLGPQAGRALLDIATGWDCLEMKDETGQIHWRSEWRANPRFRKLERRVLVPLYFVLAFAGLMIGFSALRATAGVLASWTAWVYVMALIGLAFGCLGRHGALVAAERSMTRWLRPPRESENNTDGIVLLTSLSDLLPGEASSEQHSLPTSAP